MSVTTIEQAQTTPQVSRARRMAWPVTATVLTLGATAYIARVDPNQGGYPICPLKALTGLDCPACGGLRCVHALATGDIGAALDQNILAVIVLPIFAVLGMVWLYQRWTGVKPVRSAQTLAIQRGVLLSFFGAMIVFTVLRNIPGITYLPSGFG